jgi:hypothetical protein
MVVTAARPCVKGIPLQCEDCAVDSKCYRSRKSMIHPPDKIFGGIPARSLNFPRFSEGLQFIADPTPVFALQNGGNSAKIYILNKAKTDQRINVWETVFSLTQDENRY